MRVIVRYSIPSMTAEQYEEATHRIAAAGREWPPRGLEYHACFGEEATLQVIEVWSSRRQLEEYGRWMLPLTANVGIEINVEETEVSEIHNVVKP